MFKELGFLRVAAAALFALALCGAGAAQAQSALADQPVVVSTESYQSKEPYDLVYSNVAFLNALFDNYFYVDEVPQDALRSYYVDFYNFQINNGGFEQFARESVWDPELIGLIRDALEAMGAKQNLALFNKGAGILKSASQAELEAFFASPPGEANKIRAELDAVTKDILALSKTENLVALNSAWLRMLSRACSPSSSSSR